MTNKGYSDYETFRKDVLHKTGVSFCTRAHFGRPLPGEENRYIRIAYAGIALAELEEGLNNFKKFAESEKKEKEAAGV
jgi:aspartate/methionine/tyrosine aminotransferase